MAEDISSFGEFRKLFNLINIFKKPLRNCTCLLQGKIVKRQTSKGINVRKMLEC